VAMINVHFCEAGSYTLKELSVKRIIQDGDLSNTAWFERTINYNHESFIMIAMVVQGQLRQLTIYEDPEKEMIWTDASTINTLGRKQRDYGDLFGSVARRHQLSSTLQSPNASSISSEAGKEGKEIGQLS
jgi:hypothetical protein